jgi:signal peptidase
MSPPGEGPDDADNDDAGQPPEERTPSSPAEPPPRDGRRPGASDNPRQSRTGGQPPGGDAPTRDEWGSDRSQDRPSRQRGETGDRSEAQLFVYDLVSSVLAVAVVGAYLFAVSGVWPPLVAVESESMVPNMQVNDLVFVMEEHRFPGANAQDGTGVVTAQAANGSYQQFGEQGDVIVFGPDGDTRATPIIHRAMFWAEAGENWCRDANPEYLGTLDPTDRECVADHAGFITKGDNNNAYDQANGLSSPVRPEWVVGTAEFRIPGLGWIRLATQ